MDIGWNLETVLSIGAITVSVGILILIIRINWKQYGALYLLSASLGVILCYILIYLKFYTFPYRIIPVLSAIPIGVVITFFPATVLFAVRFSPQRWLWKIPFYSVLVHFGVTAEFIIENTTKIIKYNEHWGVWDSYIWWWLFLLVFEWLGGLIVKPKFRKPLNTELLRYGTVGWFIMHFILLATFFLAGVLAGSTVFR